TGTHGIDFADDAAGRGRPLEMGGGGAGSGSFAGFGVPAQAAGARGVDASPAVTGGDTFGAPVACDTGGGVTGPAHDGRGGAAGAASRGAAGEAATAGRPDARR